MFDRETATKCVWFAIGFHLAVTLGEMHMVASHEYSPYWIGFGLLRVLIFALGRNRLIHWLTTDPLENGPG